MKKTLRLKPRTLGDLHTAMEILGKYAESYSDNGGNPDGNAWLPSSDIPDDVAEMIVARGLGEMVIAFRMDDEDVATYFDVEEIFAIARETDDWDLFRDRLTADNYIHAYAHYGAYGASDSLWVVEPQKI